MTDNPINAMQHFWFIDQRAHVRAYNLMLAECRSSREAKAHAEARAQLRKEEHARLEANAAIREAHAHANAAKLAKEDAARRRLDQSRRGWVDHRWNKRDDIRDLVDLPERRVVT